MVIIKKMLLKEEDRIYISKGKIEHIEDITVDFQNETYITIFHSLYK